MLSGSIYRHENALNTVGYKEMFQVLDGTWELPFAVERMKKNTRVYAKKQMTWFSRDPDIHWITVPSGSPEGSVTVSEGSPEGLSLLLDDDDLEPTDDDLFDIEELDPEGFDINEE